MSFSMQSSLQYLTFLHLQIVLKMFLLLHHSQTPMTSFSPILNLKANLSVDESLNSATINYFLLKFTCCNLRAELMSGSKLCPGNSIPLLISISTPSPGSSILESSSLGLLPPLATLMHLDSSVSPFSTSDSMYIQSLISLMVIFWPAQFK